jgi:hypothetical protein
MAVFTVWRHFPSKPRIYAGVIMICDGCGRDVVRMRHVEQLDKWLCRECDPGVRYDPNVPGAMFPFSSYNIGTDASRGPITANSLRHLRKLEKEYGVQSIAFNMDSKHWPDPPRNKKWSER